MKQKKEIVKELKDIEKYINIPIKTFKNKDVIYNLYIEKLLSIVDNIDYYYLKMIDNYNNIYIFNKHRNYTTLKDYFTCMNIYTEKNIKVNKTMVKLYNKLEDINKMLRSGE